MNRFSVMRTDRQFQGAVTVEIEVELAPVKPETRDAEVGTVGIALRSTKYREIKLPPAAPQSTYAKTEQLRPLRVSRWTNQEGR